MSPAAFTAFLTDLLSEESIVHFTPIVAQRASDRSTFVSWANRLPGASRDVVESTIQEYVADLRGNNYTCLLPNAALLQIEYSWHSGEIKYHRYCYMPAPFDLDGQTIQPEEIENLVDLASNMDLSKVRLKTKLRFEFDETQAAEGHPASHLHLHYPSCRIPVRASIGVHSLFRFIFKYFCYETFVSSNVLSRRRDDGGRVTLTAQEGLEAHVFWQLQ